MEFDFIALPYTDAVAECHEGISQYKDGRWSWSSQLYGHAFAAHRGTLGAPTTFGNGRNDEHVSVMGFNDSPSPSYMGGRPGRNCCGISACRSRATTPDTGSSTVLAPPLHSRFDLSDRNTLLWDGVSTFTVGRMELLRWKT